MPLKWLIIKFLISGEETTKKVSSMNYYAYRLMIRQNADNYLLRFRRLFQQYCVDMYVKIETERLTFIRLNQAKCRYLIFFVFFPIKKKVCLFVAIKAEQSSPGQLVNNRKVSHMMRSYVGILYKKTSTYNCQQNYFEH